MNCNDIETFAPLWLSGELDSAQGRAFSAHLTGCAACTRLLKEQSALDSRISAALRTEIAGAEHIQRRVIKRMFAERLRNTLLVAAVAAGVLAVLFIGYRSRTNSPTNMPAAQVLIDAARDHRAEIMEHQPRHWRTQMPEIEQMVERFGLTAAKAASIAPQGYRLSQVRTCGLEGQPALHLVFTDGVQELSIYLRKSSGSDSLQAAALGNERLASITTAGFNTVAVTTGNMADCREIARHAASVLQSSRL